MAALGGRFATVVLPLSTPRLSLRLFEAQDAPRLAQIVSKRSVHTGLAIEHRRYTVAEERRFVRTNRAVAAKGQALPLVITLRPSGRSIGVVSLRLTPGSDDRGGLGYWIAPQYWHRGYGTEAVATVCRTAFQELRLHRIEASVFDSNPRSIALLKRLGFRDEGHRREVRKHRGKWEGEVVFDLLSKDLRLPAVLSPHHS